MKKSFQCLVLALSAAAGTPSGTAGPAFFYRETESIATHSPRRIIIASTDVDRVMAFDGNAKAVKAVNAAVSIDGKSIYIPETQGHPFVGITCWADDAMWVDLDAGTLSVRNGKIVADPSADSDMEISFEGEDAVITFRGHPGKKVQYDIDNGCFVLTDRDMGGICIFQEDIYMADFADGHTPPRKEGDPVRLTNLIAAANSTTLSTTAHLSGRTRWSPRAGRSWFRPAPGVSCCPITAAETHCGPCPW